ncbi:hypothetical protein BDZ45DRAFT_752689 [Acephala macrosclerotiorum]|nr:hypothetical protein BDZ45DRAFT_752689 [Acephala macrosclerotiorum]
MSELHITPPETYHTPRSRPQTSTSSGTSSPWELIMSVSEMGELRRQSFAEEQVDELIAKLELAQGKSRSKLNSISSNNSKGPKPDVEQAKSLDKDESSEDEMMQRISQLLRYEELDGKKRDEAVKEITELFDKLKVLGEKRKAERLRQKKRLDDAIREFEEWERGQIEEKGDIVEGQEAEELRRDEEGEDDVETMEARAGVQDLTVGDERC